MILHSFVSYPLPIEKDPLQQTVTVEVRVLEKNSNGIGIIRHPNDLEAGLIQSIIHAWNNNDISFFERYFTLTPNPVLNLNGFELK